MLNKPQLKTFCWKGVDANGKKLSGTIRAINKRFVKIELIKKQIDVTRINQDFQIQIFKIFKEKLSQKDITLMMRQMATLFCAGIPLLQTINALAISIKKPAAKTLLNAIQKDIQEGHPLSYATQKHAKIFDHFAQNFILVGEQSGTLDIMLERIATHREKNEKLKAKIKKALLYPIITIIVAVLITIFMLVFIVPQFETLFSSFGTSLPWPTQMTLQLSRVLTHHGFVFLLVTMLLIFLFVCLKKRCSRWHEFLDKKILNIPVLGKILQKNMLARLCRTLSLSMTSGMPIVEALELIKNMIHNTLLTDELTQIKKLIEQGNSLYSSLKSAGIFPHMMLQMVAIGEEAGQLSEMLHKVADYYETEIDQLIDGLSQLIEPAIMLFLGCIIGGLIVTMYLPIFKLGTVM